MTSKRWECNATAVEIGSSGLIVFCADDESHVFRLQGVRPTCAYPSVLVKQTPADTQGRS